MLKIVIFVDEFFVFTPAGLVCYPLYLSPFWRLEVGEERLPRSYPSTSLRTSPSILRQGSGQAGSKCSAMTGSGFPDTDFWNEVGRAFRLKIYYMPLYGFEPMKPL